MPELWGLFEVIGQAQPNHDSIDGNLGAIEPPVELERSTEAGLSWSLSDWISSEQHQRFEWYGSVLGHQTSRGGIGILDERALWLVGNSQFAFLIPIIFWFKTT